MVRFLIYGMVYAGSALMVLNIYRYVLFSRKIRGQGNWDKERQLFRIPIILLILFLAGYLCVGLFGHPDAVIAGILFGGSIFVLVMLILIQRATDRIQENNSLEARLMAAEEASRAKTFFLSNMSHDIRTPLNAIIGYTGLANRECVSSEEKTEYLRKIENAGYQLLDIVNDVLEMSRIESGRMELVPVRMNICDGLQDTADLVRTQMDSRHISLSVSCSAQHPWVMCDRNRLNRVLMNLLCNAGKFTGEGGKVCLALRETAADSGTGTYEIRVRDTGIGMSPEFVGRLFEPFERERTSTVSNIQGTGLGMAITKGILDLMGGRIEVSTKQGEGTEFIITLSLPLAEDMAAAGEETVRQKADFQGVRLLLAEDNAVNREIALMILQQAGFEVDTAENGKQAVDMLSASDPGYYAAVLMDIQMPVMDGYTAARQIRSLEDPELASVPVIAMTANAFREDVEAAADAGMNGHIAKPLDVDAMMDTLGKNIGGVWKKAD